MTGIGDATNTFGLLRCGPLAFCLPSSEGIASASRFIPALAVVSSGCWDSFSGEGASSVSAALTFGVDSLLALPLEAAEGVDGGGFDALEAGAFFWDPAGSNDNPARSERNSFEARSVTILDGLFDFVDRAGGVLVEALVTVDRLVVARRGPLGGAMGESDDRRGLFAAK